MDYDIWYHLTKRGSLIVLIITLLNNINSMLRLLFIGLPGQMKDKTFFPDLVRVGKATWTWNMYPFCIQVFQVRAMSEPLSIETNSKYCEWDKRFVCGNCLIVQGFDTIFTVILFPYDTIMVMANGSVSQRSQTRCPTAVPCDGQRMRVSLVQNC
jgi:hypothetical protein